jgi:hypothetical protein
MIAGVDCVEAWLDAMARLNGASSHDRRGRLISVVDCMEEPRHVVHLIKDKRRVRSPQGWNPSP